MQLHIYTMSVPTSQYQGIATGFNFMHMEACMDKVRAGIPERGESQTFVLERALTFWQRGSCSPLLVLRQGC